MVVRGRQYRRDTLSPTPLPRLVDDRSRWRKTDVSFGVAGRVACSAVVFVPLWRFLATGSIFWLLATFASVIPGGWWLRETWRRT